LENATLLYKKLQNHDYIYLDTELCRRVLSTVKSKLYYDRRSVGKSVLMSSIHLGTATSSSLSLFNYFLGSCGCVVVGRPHWREIGSVVFSHCWASPAESFSGLSPAGVMTKFHFHNIGLPNLESQVPYLYSQEQNRPVITPGIGFEYHSVKHCFL
jgi:hypothetical protein